MGEEPTIKIPDLEGGFNGAIDKASHAFEEHDHKDVRKKAELIGRELKDYSKSRLKNQYDRYKVRARRNKNDQEYPHKEVSVPKGVVGMDQHLWLSEIELTAGYGALKRQAHVLKLIIKSHWTGSHTLKFILTPDPLADVH